MSLLHGQKPFLETNAWQKPHLNSLRYNTSQVGSVLPLIYGTTRQQINLIALGDYRGPNGKKGKVGPLPLSGTHAGKGGGGSKKGSSKKSSDYSVDVDFALCQGPVDIPDKALVWASGATAFFQSVGLNLYKGEDGQPADPVFEGLGDIVGYSGTCHVTGTPMDLGSSPVLPNLSFEVTGFFADTGGAYYPHDANPGSIIKDFLTNERYGAGFPADNLDDIATIGINSYADYCQAASLSISVALQNQTDAASWLSELAKLTNTAIVWSGAVLKFVPYGDLALSGNGGTWTPNLTPLYSLNDDHFLPWNPHIDATDPQEGEDDPVIVVRSNPADATNWMSIEYTDRQNDYNKTIIAQFDQGMIDQYGLRTETSINGNCFCEVEPAKVSLRLMLQRALYVRNTYKFQLGWQYALLEPMDIVLLSDWRCGLNGQAVRITSIEENENGDLICEGEEIKTEDSVVETGCSVEPVDFRFALPNYYSLHAKPPNAVDKFGNLYAPDRYGAENQSITIYDTSGAIVDTVSYYELWDKIFAFAGINHGPIYGSSDTADSEHFNYYQLWPIHNGEYILAYICRVHSGADFAFWWALLEPGSLDVLGAYYYTGLVAWPYTGGQHVMETWSADQAILVQSYAFLGSWTAVLGALPSINEFKSGTYNAGFDSHYTAFRIPNTMIYPLGTSVRGNKDFSEFLFSNGGRPTHNNSLNFGFFLPDRHGGMNYYMYTNRMAMDSFATLTSFNNVEFRDVIQPANPLGAMIKIPLGDLTFPGLAREQLFTTTTYYRGAPSGDYSVDNASWTDETGAAAIPFTDEYTHISDDTVGGDDVYSLQTSIIDRGGGVYWVVFYMVGRADAYYRAAPDISVNGYKHPIYERIRVFEYHAGSETAKQITKFTCILHDTDDLPSDDDTKFWEQSNDNFQIFTARTLGQVATLHISGALFRKPFCTVAAPLTLS